MIFGHVFQQSGIKQNIIRNDIAESMGCNSPEETAEKFTAIFSSMELEIPEATEQDIETLSSSVNPERLKNFPAALSTDIIKSLYRQILRVKE